MMPLMAAAANQKTSTAPTDNLSCCRVFASVVLICLCLLSIGIRTAVAAFTPITVPPLAERWFGIYLGGEQVGFYRQQITRTNDGYRFDGNGSVRMKVMSFAKEASMRETYYVSKKLALRSFDVEQAINGTTSHVSGTVGNGVLTVKNTANGKTSDKVLKFKGEVLPGPALNIYPLMRPLAAGTEHNVQLFDPEELKIKSVRITVIGEDKASDGTPALKLSNNLYPYVSNDIWVDSLGNTIEESVRNGLVSTKVAAEKTLGRFISEWAIAKKDLIYDFSLVREQPPLRDAHSLKGLRVEISNWNDSIPLLTGDMQQAGKPGASRALFSTGTLNKMLPVKEKGQPAASYLESADKIEATAPEIVTQAGKLAVGTKDHLELSRAIASWTAAWLKDTVDDGGGALDSLASKHGNCQTHARLYTALARAAGIPTRFVSGLVHQEGRGFLYHSWAESYLDGRWLSIDPTFNQFPADPTHIKLFEGHLPDDMAPLVALIGRIRMTVLETAY